MVERWQQRLRSVHKNTVAAGAISPSDRRLPILAYKSLQESFDADMRRMLRDAAKEASRMINSSTGVRQLQYRLAKQQIELWAKIGKRTDIGIRGAVDLAAEVDAFFNAKLLAKVGFDTSMLADSMIAQARQGVVNLLARQQNGIALSKRVYKNAALASGKVDAAVNSGIATGKSAKEIAKSVKHLISPDTPGGTSYAAMRLGRTELNNAFHTTQQNQYKMNPFVETVTWHLSGSHGRDDICDEYAEGIHLRKGSAGEFLIDEVPDKPHPQCLCYTSPNMVDEDTFVSNYHKGVYDEYLMWELGLPK